MKPTRDNIIARIRVMTGIDPPEMTPSEVDYIYNLEGDYQELAILQACLGILQKRNDLPLAQDVLKEQIQKLSEQIWQKEKKDIDSNNAWVNKYGDIQYVKKAGKIKAVLPENVEWKAAECELCNDTGWIVDYGKAGYNASKYPCSCEKGTEKAKKTEYMGSPTPLGKGVTNTANYVNVANQKAKAKEIKIAQEKKEYYEKLNKLKQKIKNDKEKLSKWPLFDFGGKHKEKVEELNKLKNEVSNLQTLLEEVYGTEFDSNVLSNLSNASVYDKVQAQMNQHFYSQANLAQQAGIQSVAGLAGNAFSGLLGSMAGQALSNILGEVGLPVSQYMGPESVHEPVSVPAIVPEPALPPVKGRRFR